MWVFIVVAALITLPFAIGSLMPERYEGQVAVETLPPIEGRPCDPVSRHRYPEG